MAEAEPLTEHAHPVPVPGWLVTLCRWFAAVGGVALLVMMLLGELLGFAGDRLPIIKTYLGGGAILALFGAAAMVYFGWLSKAVADDVASFMKGGGFLDFYIAALITGSILGMDAKVLVKVGSRYALPLLC